MIRRDFFVLVDVPFDVWTSTIETAVEMKDEMACNFACANVTCKLYIYEGGTCYMGRQGATDPIAVNGTS